MCPAFQVHARSHGLSVPFVIFSKGGTAPALVLEEVSKSNVYSLVRLGPSLIIVGVSSAPTQCCAMLVVVKVSEPTSFCQVGMLEW
jgi:hypothetical protein